LDLSSCNHISLWPGFGLDWCCSLQHWPTVDIMFPSSSPLKLTTTITKCSTVCTELWESLTSSTRQTSPLLVASMRNVTTFPTVWLQSSRYTLNRWEALEKLVNLAKLSEDLWNCGIEDFGILNCGLWTKT